MENGDGTRYFERLRAQPRFEKYIDTATTIEVVSALRDSYQQRRASLTVSGVSAARRVIARRHRPVKYLTQPSKYLTQASKYLKATSKPDCHENTESPTVTESAPAWNLLLSQRR